METRDPHYVSSSESDADHTHRPPKRARHSSPSDRSRTNGRNATSSSGLPPLSLSILGVEPLDEFIREVADFVHHSITTRPADLMGEIEVEAKIGVLRDRGGNRLQLPVLVETSMIFIVWNIQEIYDSCQSLLQKLQTPASSLTCLK
jgi:polynucleotide 5'-triphosphatase